MVVGGAVVVVVVVGGAVVVVVGSVVVVVVVVVGGAVVVVVVVVVAGGAVVVVVVVVGGLLGPWHQVWVWVWHPWNGWAVEVSETDPRANAPAVIAAQLAVRARTRLTAVAFIGAVSTVSSVGSAPHQVAAGFPGISSSTVPLRVPASRTRQSSRYVGIPPNRIRLRSTSAIVGERRDPRQVLLIESVRDTGGLGTRRR